MKQSRTTIWLVLIGVCVGLFITYVLCVPFMHSVVFIERRTGLLSAEVRWLGVFTEHRLIAVRMLGNPTFHPEWSRLLTAPEKRIPVRIHSRRFVWSERRDERLQPDAGYEHAFVQLFLFNRFQGRNMTQDERDTLVKSRILIWNSPALDLNPQAVGDQAQSENDPTGKAPSIP